MPFTHNIVLHVGYPKSGSSYLQDVVFNRPDIRIYRQPDMTYLSKAEPFSPEILRATMTPDLLEPRQPQKLTFISQEKFSGFLDSIVHCNPFRMAERLHRAYPEARILMVTRNQMQYTLSMYCWRVVHRGLEQRSLDLYLNDKFASQLKDKLAYHELAECYISLFGRTSTKILPLELQRHDNARFASELSELAALRIEAPSPARNINATERSLAFIDRCRRLNRGLAVVAKTASLCLPHRRSRPLRQNLLAFKRRYLLPMISPSGRKPATDITLPEHWQEVYQEAFRASNRRLQALSGFDLRALGYPV